MGFLCICLYFFLFVYKKNIVLYFFYFFNYFLFIVYFKGAYGKVYKARDLTNGGKIVALKKVKVPLTEDGVPMSTLREIALLKQLDSFDHPNIVK